MDSQQRQTDIALIAVHNIYVPKMYVCLTCWGYRGGSPIAVQAWRPCRLWEPFPSHPIVLV